MQTRDKLNRYSPSRYDEYLCLKPPLMLWIALVYLSRAITLPLLVTVSSLGGGTSDTTQFIRGLFSLSTLFPSFIAATVLYALIRRSPSGSAFARWIWARGRALLTVSAVLDFVLSLAGSPLLHGDVTEPVALSLLTAAFDLYFLVYILASKRARDTFADFPAPDATVK